MKSIHRNQRDTAFGLLVSLLLQSCGVGQPSELQPVQATASQLQHTDAVQQVAVPPGIATAHENDHQLNPAGSATGSASTIRSNETGLIHDVTDLIQGLSQPSITQAQSRPLQEWFKGYTDCFQALDLTHVKEAEVEACLEEYKLLAHIKCIDNTRQFLRDYWHSILGKLEQPDQMSGYREVPFMRMTSYVLEYIDPAIFKDTDVQRLAALLDDQFLTKLDTDKKLFIKSAYKNHAPILESVYHIFSIIQKIDDSAWDSERETGLYQRIKKQLASITSATTYYPILYHTHLLLQALCQYEQDGNEEDELFKAVKGVYEACQGAIGVYGAWQGLMQELFVPDKKAKEVTHFHLTITQFATENLQKHIDLWTQPLSSFRKAYDHFRGIFRDTDPDKRSYLAYHQALYLSSKLALQSDDVSRQHYDVFEKYVEEVEQACKAKHLTSADKKALRYCILRQLGMLSLHARSENTRKSSIEKLIALSLRWSEDSSVEEDIQFSLLDGLATISQWSMHDTDKAKASETLEAWARAIESLRAPSAPRIPLVSLNVRFLYSSAWQGNSQKAAIDLARLQKRVDQLPKTWYMLVRWLDLMPTNTPRDQDICYTDQVLGSRPLTIL